MTTADPSPFSASSSGARSRRSRTGLAARIFERIEGDKLTPRPRWEFVFKNYVFWTLGAVAVVLGAFAFAAGVFEVQNAGWSYATATHPDFLTFFLAVAPFLWIVALVLFISLGYVNIRRTERGYRYPLAVIAIGAVLTSVALGSGLYAAGFGGEIEESLGTHLPFYRPIISEEHEWWLAPQKGLLGGTVISLASTTQRFVLRDFSGRIWSVDTTDLRGNDLIVLSRGGTVRVVGVPTSATSSVFHACFVFPWKVVGLMQRAVPTPPIFVPALSTETATSAPRSELCKGIAPYTRLRTLDGDGF